MGHPKKKKQEPNPLKMEKSHKEMNHVPSIDSRELLVLGRVSLNITSKGPHF